MHEKFIISLDKYREIENEMFTSNRSPDFIDNSWPISNFCDLILNGYHLLLKWGAWWWAINVTFIELGYESGFQVQTDNLG